MCPFGCASCWKRAKSLVEPSSCSSLGCSGLADEGTLTDPGVKHHQLGRMTLESGVESAGREGDVLCMSSSQNAGVWKVFQVLGEQNNY